ncbi:MAG: 3-isopropylmalate dehydratase small subunit [Sulfuritalea sp.]|jgi:3-isopropylmalate/(R)-2-methylmalate dehydratase small subunit|nr:3-isopropylmalate dehydratase small subunit [Sulfuritalea sp.]
MKAFKQLNGLVCPLDRANVDTDAIIPKQFLKSIKRSGFGPYLFDEWRYSDTGEPGMDCTNRPRRKDFVLNQPRYKGAQVLLARDNFGCGSSREHAPWAIEDYGFQVIIAPSFADIFFGNCYKNGILPIVASPEIVDQLFRECAATEGYRLRVDLETQTVRNPSGEWFSFDITPHRKHCLLNGLDEIGLSLQHADEIRAFEARHKAAQPWLFALLA